MRHTQHHMRTQHHLNAAIYRYDDDTGEEHELSLSIRFTVTPYEKATWGYDGGSPEEPASIEIWEIKYEGTQDEVEVTDAEMDSLKDQARDHLAGMYEG